MTAPDPLSVICPLCGALPGEGCTHRMQVTFADRAERYHEARVLEAARVRALNAEPTRPL